MIASWRKGDKGNRTVPLVVLVLLAALAWAGVRGSSIGAPARRAHQVALGRNVQPAGSHRIEANVERGGRVRVFVLGKRDTDLFAIPASLLQAEVRPGDEDIVDVALRAQAQPGDPPGRSSQFVGTLPPHIAGRSLHLAVTVPLEGTLHRVHFLPQAFPEERFTDETARHVAMPVPLAGGATNTNNTEPTAAERARFLRPGGRYSQADIAANGGQVPSQRFRGFVPTHNPNPPKGARLCPITKTQANAQIAWVVGGKTYQFCCPPCVEEFVKQAKENPRSIRPPQHYVKR